jgi:hypothetical protein
MNMNNDAPEFGLIMHRNLRRKKVGLGPLRLLSFLGMTMGVLILMAMAAPSAHAALLTYYNFEDGNLTSDSPGLQTTSITGTAGQVFPLDSGSGTNVNAVPPTPSTNFSLVTTPAFPGGTPSFTLGGLTTTGLTDVNLSFALVGQPDSFTTLDLSYSIDGGATFKSFLTLFGIQTVTTYTALGLPVSALSGGAVDNQSNLFFEFSFSGATVSDSAIRIDNIQVTAVPEPSSYIGALFGLVGLCWYQRRRFTRLLSLRSA